MPYCRIKPARSICGEIFLPGDKSIAHRSIIISAIAKGKTYIDNFPTSRDCRTTCDAFKKLGIRISTVSKSKEYLNLCVTGNGLGLKKPSRRINVTESGTTTRLILGVLAGQEFPVTLFTQIKSLSNRPMRRITKPLRKMGAQIEAREERNNEYLPIRIRGGSLRSIRYKLSVPSAQVKSALLLAGLYAKGITKIIEPVKTRDHTERMLKDFGAGIKVKDKLISISSKKELVSPGKINIPGDISSASFFIIAAILLPRSHLLIKSVSLNPTRLGLIRVLKRMKAQIKLIPRRRSGGDPIGDIVIKSSKLSGTKVKRSEIPQLIDELPILMVAACFAKGKTVIEGVQELRVKETDRINSMQANLSKMGAEIEVSYSSRSAGLQEKIVIRPTGRLRGARVSSFNDHRTAMSMIIAGLVADGPTLIDDDRCIAKSFPGFRKVLRGVVK
ncbi:MAG: 3-phosphoshikimate 1-carboxyvinyltransferase [Candidatus Omnitrophota bacterium]|jgi:3-phosphoshikimate 1-carboxyvinyltransferase